MEDNTNIKKKRYGILFTDRLPEDYIDGEISNKMGRKGNGESIRWSLTLSVNEAN